MNSVYVIHQHTLYSFAVHVIWLLALCIFLFHILWLKCVLIYYGWKWLLEISKREPHTATKKKDTFSIWPTEFEYSWLREKLFHVVPDDSFLLCFQHSELKIWSNNNNELWTLYAQRTCKNAHQCYRGSGWNISGKAHPQNFKEKKNGTKSEFIAFLFPINSSKTPFMQNNLISK